MNFDDGQFGPYPASDFDEILELILEDLNERNITEHGRLVRFKQLKNQIDSHRPEHYQDNHKGLSIVGEAYGASAMYIHAKGGRVSLERLVVAQSGNCFTAEEATGEDDEFIVSPEVLLERSSKERKDSLNLS